MTIKKAIVGAALSTLMLGAVAVPVNAAPGDNGNGVGGCVDNLYGNATNERPSGHGVLPSQSPGPFVNTGVNEPPRNDRVRGASVGDVMQYEGQLVPEGLNGRETLELLCLAP